MVDSSEDRVHQILAKIVDLDVPEKIAVMEAACLSPEEMRMLVRLMSSREEEAFQDSANATPRKRPTSSPQRDPQRPRLVHS